jgi:putative flippase GtrA
MSSPDLRSVLDIVATVGGHASPRVTQFLRYTLTGSASLVLDLILLWIFIELFHVHYLVSAGCAFAIAISVNYVTGRAYVFQESSRGLVDGYVRFVGIALLGIALLLTGMYVLVDMMGMRYMFARLLVGSVVGLWNYSINAFWNFAE